MASHPRKTLVRRRPPKRFVVKRLAGGWYVQDADLGYCTDLVASEAEAKRQARQLEEQV